jgi:hypothetical protein
MGGTNRTEIPFDRLWWPERKPVTGSDRELATRRIERARVSGALTGEQSRQRRALLPAATTRADLRVALAGLPGEPSDGLLTLRRVVVGLCLGLTLLQFSIWVPLCLISLHFVAPWWLWSAATSVLLIGGLWWATESVYRTSPEARGPRTAGADPA